MKLTEEQRERISLSIYLHFDRFKLSTVDSFLDELEEILTEPEQCPIIFIQDNEPGKD